MIWFLGYCAGLLVTTGTIFGANAYARVLDRDDPFPWDGPGWNGDEKAVMKNLCAMFAWPILWCSFCGPEAHAMQAVIEEALATRGPEFQKKFAAALDKAEAQVRSRVS